MPIISTEKVASRDITEGKSYAGPLALVTSLFFLWGLANILNSALIAHFQPVFTIGRAEAMLVESAFYLGYFTIAIPAGLFMEKYSYKKGILLGLFLYAFGAFLFVPAAKLLMFGFFLMALYIIACGLAFLETGANPYVIMLGKADTATRRLNFSQSFNGVALIVGPWLAGKFIFAGNEGAMDTLASKQQAADAVIFPYVLIGAVVLFVAVLFLLIRMPEPDKGEGIKFNKEIFKKKHLVLAVIAQLFYVGAQVGIWGLTLNYIIENLPGTSLETASSIYMVIGTTLFVSGRFIGTFLLNKIQDHKLLLIYGACAAILCVISAFTTGLTSVGTLLAVNFFMSIMFPTIFSLGIKDLGDQTKLGSSLIIMSIVGGAIIPPIMGHIDIHLSLLLPAVAFVLVMYYGWKGYEIKS
jgi:MFS transporter, FHS family, L-fucose permease